MPHKFNAARRHKFSKKRYRVTNWASYNENLRQQGDLTVWINTDALKLWAAPRRISRGGQPKYSDLAITICLTLSMIYKQPLRQTQGLTRDVAKLMGFEYRATTVQWHADRAAQRPKITKLAQNRPCANMLRIGCQVT